MKNQILFQKTRGNGFKMGCQYGKSGDGKKIISYMIKISQEHRYYPESLKEINQKAKNIYIEI